MTLESYINTRTVSELVDVLCKQEARNLTDVKSQTISSCVIKVSSFEGLSLSEYVVAKKERCKKIHKNFDECSKCSPLVNAANIVIEKSPVALPYLWNRCFPKIPYSSEKAQRKILQMPVSSLNANGAVYIVEKK